MELNCLWYSRQPGQSPDEELNYKTRVNYNGGSYYYSDEPEKVKKVWEAQERFKWQQTDQEEGTTLLDVTSNNDRLLTIWISVSFLCVLSFLIFIVTSKKFPGFGVTQILIFILSLQQIAQIKSKKNKIPDLEDDKKQ